VLWRLNWVTDELTQMLWQGWDKLGDYPKVEEYLCSIQKRDSWKNTHYAPEIVVAGWKAH